VLLKADELAEGAGLGCPDQRSRLVVGMKFTQAAESRSSTPYDSLYFVWRPMSVIVIGPAWA